jgi:hypothetical protein
LFIPIPLILFSVLARGHFNLTSPTISLRLSCLPWDNHCSNIV